MSRAYNALKAFPRSGLLCLAILSLFFAWYSVYVRLTEFIAEQGTSVEAIGRSNIFLQAFDATLIIFSILVFVASGAVPFVLVLAKPKEIFVTLAMCIWGASILGFIYAARVFS